MIDEVLAQGRKSNYTFVYTPGVPNPKGEIWTYTVAARPRSSMKNDRRRSFFTDESGIIRYTLEDRVATVQDPVID